MSKLPKANRRGLGGPSLSQPLQASKDQPCVHAPNPPCKADEEIVKILQSSKDPSLRIPASILQGWALDLSQGDMSPRWEIEAFLTNNGLPIRNPNT